jgi:hypothetical protein
MRTDEKRWEAKLSKAAANYGITMQEANELYSRGSCESCGNSDRTMNIDHCHETGKVRGLLCGDCNRALGLLGDKEENILSLLNYKRKHGHDN